MQIPMLQVILLLSVAVLGSSIIVPLRIANETDYFYPNGTLDAASVRHHIRYVQCHFQQSDIAKSVCRFDTPLPKRAVESIGLFSAYHAATPVGELRIGGQAINVIFDTVRRSRTCQCVICPDAFSQHVTGLNIRLLLPFAPCDGYARTIDAQDGFRYYCRSQNVPP